MLHFNVTFRNDKSYVVSGSCRTEKCLFFLVLWELKIFGALKFFIGNATVYHVTVFPMAVYPRQSTPNHYAVDHL